MFVEKIDEQFLKEIEDALYEEHDEIIANWDGEFIDLKNSDFDDTLRSEIFGDYLNIPLHMLMDLICKHFPFIKEKNVGIIPFSNVIISENHDNKEILLRVYVDVHNSDREMLSEIELRQLDKLLEELTQLYENLDIDTTLYIKKIPIDDVPEDFLNPDEENYDFVQIGF